VLIKQVNIHVPIGKVSFDNEKLIENFKAINAVVVAAKPATAKGTYITNLSVTTTMGAGVKVDTTSF
jgi:LSU ribosomal protein L1P